MMPRRITILGSTGSVGRSTLALVTQSQASEQPLVVEALTAGRNVELLIRQALEFKPKIAVIGEASLLPTLEEGLAGSGIETAAGQDAICDIARRPVDRVVAAIVGFAGLASTLAAAEAGAIIALANKESLVCGGHLIAAALKASGGKLLPVDSEHNAIFQVLDQNQPVRRLILTASGGPFRKAEHDVMRAATPKDALAHPVWNMGDKISIDCATLMNKGLELIEATHLFEMSEDRIDILVHPQSVVHSLVEYEDGSVLAQMGSPDMRIPIAHALAWPARMKTGVDKLDLIQVGKLEFEAPDTARFPSLLLARQACRSGQAAQIVLNAANEVAVDAFLKRKIGFLDIAGVVADVLSNATQQGLIGSSMQEPNDFKQVMDLDALSRESATIICIARER